LSKIERDPSGADAAFIETYAKNLPKLITVALDAHEKASGQTEPEAVSTSGGGYLPPSDGKDPSTMR
jgi:hypothetical protein